MRILVYEVRIRAGLPATKMSGNHEGRPGNQLVEVLMDSELFDKTPTQIRRGNLAQKLASGNFPWEISSRQIQFDYRGTNPSQPEDNDDEMEFSMENSRWTEPLERNLYTNNREGARLWLAIGKDLNFGAFSFARKSMAAQAGRVNELIQIAIQRGFLCLAITIIKAFPLVEIQWRKLVTMALHSVNSVGAIECVRSVLRQRPQERQSLDVSVILNPLCDAIKSGDTKIARLCARYLTLKGKFLLSVVYPTNADALWFYVYVLAETKKVRELRTMLEELATPPRGRHLSAQTQILAAMARLILRDQFVIPQCGD